MRSLLKLFFVPSALITYKPLHWPGEFSLVQIHTTLSMSHNNSNIHTPHLQLLAHEPLIHNFGTLKDLGLYTNNLIQVHLSLQKRKQKSKRTVSAVTMFLSLHKVSLTEVAYFSRCCLLTTKVQRNYSSSSTTHKLELELPPYLLY